MSRVPCWTPRTTLASVIACAAISAAGCADRSPPLLAPRPPHNFGTRGCGTAEGDIQCPPPPAPCSATDGTCDCDAPGSTSCAAPTPPGAGSPAADSTTPRLRIVTAQGPNPERSFTTRTGERTLTLAADTRPSMLAGMVTWTIVDDPADRVHSAASPVAPPNGPTATVDVPSQTTERWRLPHGAPWTDKALAFKVVAEAPGAGGGTPLRDSVVVRQRELDVLRQEYVDFKIPVPGAGDVKTAADVAGLTRFAWSELNQGDYGKAVLTSLLLNKLGEVEADAQYRLTLNSVFRNPAHQRHHIDVSGGGSPAPVSQHQYGTAVDFHTPRNVRVWADLRDVVKRAGACAEPLRISTLNHVHADWRPGAPQCPANW